MYLALLLVPVFILGATVLDTSERGRIFDIALEKTKTIRLTATQKVRAMAERKGVVTIEDDSLTRRLTASVLRKIADALSTTNE